MRVDTRGAISSILDLALWLQVVTCLHNARSMRLGVGPHCNCLGVVYCHLNQHNSSIRCRKGSISRHISRYPPNYRAGCSLPAQPLPGPSWSDQIWVFAAKLVTPHRECGRTASVRTKL